MTDRLPEIKNLRIGTVNRADLDWLIAEVEQLRKDKQERTADWHAGAQAEQQARDKGLSGNAKDIRATLEAMARLHQDASCAELVGVLFRIYTADMMDGGGNAMIDRVEKIKQRSTEAKLAHGGIYVTAADFTWLLGEIERLRGLLGVLSEYADNVEADRNRLREIVRSSDAAAGD